ncbi:34572_t:CDS:2 [Gigaspora margarita]|uniref:34572_t:CDS:1 n=1 Tax=Gigaspora margarita TaxID=4874 RepID=A0ABM8W5B3_GIGMA|nr:34572_t:CDS:2 [Gigaspora margarita]
MEKNILNSFLYFLKHYKKHFKTLALRLGIQAVIIQVKGKVSITG